MSAQHAARLAALRAKLAGADSDAFFSFSPPANQYLTGFSGSTSALVVTPDQARFLCDFRYTEQAGQQVLDYDVEEVKGDMAVRVGERLDTLGVKAAAFDPGVVSVSQSTRIQTEFRGAFKPLPDAVSSLRMIKTNEEIEKIRAASQLAEAVLADLLDSTLRAPGSAGALSERELAARFEYEFKRRGAEGAAFDTIALFGSRTSLVHGQPSDRPLEKGDIVLLDLGCRKAGYCSDLTRTYAYGTMPDAWFREIYEVTLTAQKAALNTLKAGIRCREVDAVARTIIHEAGYGDYFGHGLGHGVGIEVHEEPRLNAESQAVLEHGMVVTIEPGIYLPERGGVRIEDLVLVTKEGREVLSSAPKELEVLAE